MIHTLQELFERDLTKLKKEINTYANESNLWVTSREIANSAGNLALHIVGNLNHFIGAEFGKTGYIRQRDDEFSLKNVPRSKILDSIDETIAIVKSVLNNISEQDLKLPYRRNPFERDMTVEYFLMHLLAHLSYHLGQINYHRRLLETLPADR